MQQMIRPSVQRNLLDLWWHRAPLVGWRLSRTLSAALADGLYLCAWPVVGASAPLLALLLGFLIGWLHFSTGETYTFSIVVMALMLVVSGMSTALGGWLLVGYVIGDFFLFPHAPDYSGGTILGTLIHVGVPLLISYVLLALLLVIIPLIAQGLRRQTVARLTVPRTVAMTIEAGAQAVTQAALVFIWVQSTPTLIRPLYVWQDRTPPVEAIQPLQHYGWILVALAAFIGVVRIVLEYRVLAQPAVVQRVALLRTEIAHQPPLRRRRLPQWVAALLKASFTTFMLAGILTTWLDALIFALVVMLILLTRESLSRLLTPWVRLISRVPLLIRIIAGVLISYLLAWQIIQAMWDSTSTFRPVLISVTTSLIAFALLVPTEKPQPQEQAKH